MRLILCIVITFFISFAGASSLRGVNPDVLSLYKPVNNQFRCLDGAKTIPYSQVNDGYCDCFDGSDEPGTAACSNGSFYCLNRGAEPLTLNSSFVDDNICDCCDGSDEPTGRCQNTCKESGLAALKALESDLVDARAGVRAKDGYIKEAAKARVEWTRRLEKLKTMESSVVSKASAAATKGDGLNAQLARLEERKRRLMEKENNKNQIDEEPSESPHSTQQVDESLQKDEQPEIEWTDEEEANSAAEEEDPDELAKRVAAQWIPGEKQKEEADVDQESGEDVKDGDEVKEEEEQEEHAPLSSENEEDSDSSLPSLGLYYRLKTQFSIMLARLRSSNSTAEEIELSQLTVAIEALRVQADAAQKQVSATRDAERDMQDEIRQLEHRIQDLTFGPDDVFAPLISKCIETTADKYTYKICPFDKAEQTEGGRSTQLGSWEGFGDDHKVLKFTNGDACWQGPSRSMTVMLRCGPTEVLSKVSEPSRCEYTSEMTTPAVCSAGQVDALRDRIELQKKLLADIMHTHQAADEL